MLHDHWAYRGVGTLRQQPADFCARIDFELNQASAPAFELAGLAGLLVTVVAEHDAQLGTFEGSDTEEEGPATLLARPSPMPMYMAEAFQRHIRLAFNSLHTPFLGWDLRFSEVNLRQLHFLRAHSGYAQVRYIALTCLATIEAAIWRHDLAAAASTASPGWHNIFAPICKRCKILRTMATLLLLGVCPVRSNATSVPSHQAWTTLRKEFLHAAAMLGLSGDRPMLQMLSQGVNLRHTATILLAQRSDLVLL